MRNAQTETDTFNTTKLLTFYQQTHETEKPTNHDAKQ